MYWHFIGIEVWSSWAAFCRSYKDAFLAMWTILLIIVEIEIEDTFIATIHVLCVVLIIYDGVPILVCFDDDLGVVWYFTSDIRGFCLPMLSMHGIKDPTSSSLETWRITLGIQVEGASTLAW